jgi:hypothetical protein
MLSQIVPNLDGPGHVCSSSNVTLLSASASACSFSKQPARLLIFINSTDPGHIAATSADPLAEGLGYQVHYVAGLWLKFRLTPFHRRTGQSMKINRSYWSGNRSRNRLKKSRRLAASARKEETGPPTGAENCKRGILSLPNAKPAPILSDYTHALPSVPPTNPGNVYCLASCWY